MLTRLRVNGFKNLIDADVSFGPFTCIAGANSVGKSNLFDAITFLSAVADRPLMDAARCVRDERNRSTDVRTLFVNIGGVHREKLSFEADMLIPTDGFDDLGQKAVASITFLRYTLELQYRSKSNNGSHERLEIVREELRHINVSDARKHLRFHHSPQWRKSVVKGARRGGPFLSTEESSERRVIKLHQDGGRGRPREISAENLPRTVLSTTNADENPTALLARREMQSWNLLQLEPSALRNPDNFSAAAHVGVDGSHLAATLHRLAKDKSVDGTDEAAVYAQVANRLSELVENVRAVQVDVDKQRELLTLQVVDHNLTLHAARSLSDGTLRFLALAILELDPSTRGVLCFEEPENGIHPERISSMLRLLKDLCVDTEEVVDEDNPLRQVIVNTHSPTLVSLVDDADLLVAHTSQTVADQKRVRGAQFSWLAETWRQDVYPDSRAVSRGQLGAYLNPLALSNGDESGIDSHAKTRRVKDRPDLQMLLFPRN